MVAQAVSCNLREQKTKLFQMVSNSLLVVFQGATAMARMVQTVEPSCLELVVSAGHEICIISSCLKSGKKTIMKGESKRERERERERERDKGKA